MYYINKKKNVCQLRDSNPRPFRTAPKAAALDHSAKLTSVYLVKINFIKTKKCIYFIILNKYFKLFLLKKFKFFWTI